MDDHEPGPTPPPGSRAGRPPEPGPDVLSVADFQRLIAERYLETDRARGTHATFLLLTEEFGELATALYNANRETHGGRPATAAERANLEEEFADVLAWLATLANINGVDLTRALSKYTESGGPRGVKP